MSETTNIHRIPRRDADSPGDVDGALRAFFQGELPKSWPAPKVWGDAEAPPARRAPTLLRSRWALAATVLGLLVGHAYLSVQFPESASGPSDRDSMPIIGRKSGTTSPNLGQPDRINQDDKKSR